MQEESVIPVRKGMAIASLVLGIVSIPTCGLLGIGSIIGIVLGVMALKNVNKNPNQYGGKGLAIAGIVTSIAGLLLIAVNAAIAIPQLNKMLKIGRESAAIETLKTIHKAEASFFAEKNRYGTLKELAAIEGLNVKVVNGRVSEAFIYTEAEISDKTFCIQATRANDSVAYQDFNITESGVIHYVEAKQPTMIPCGQGTPIQ